ncbi:MAG: pilin [Elusimicrobia bacterium]|nr:pilin [Elusimicrobiota bacterium]
MPATIANRKEKGFTLIELLVVIMVIGILSALAVPQYYKTVEKNRASEGVNLMLTLKAAQDRYWAKYGVYCNASVSSCGGFDFPPPAMKYFNPVPAFAAGGAGNQSWTLTLTRNGSPQPYGAYQLKYDVEPGTGARLTCNNTECAQDLLPH